MKKYAITILMVFLLAASISAAPAAIPVQESGPGPDTMVSSTGEILVAGPVPEGMMTSSYEGTGELAPESEQQIIDEHLNMPPIESLYGGESAGSAESVIGPDGRVQVTNTTTMPYSAIALLAIYFGASGPWECTGWYFGPDDMMTRGACIYNAALGGWATNVTVYPGRNGGTSPYGSTTSTVLYSVCGWTGIGGCASGGNPNFDYGYIKTADPLGNDTGYFGYWWQPNNTFSGDFIVDGYPFGTKPYGTQWKMAGPFTHVTFYRLWYRMDTFGSQVGGPVYKHRSLTARYCQGKCAAGIHAYGGGIAPYPNINSATRIREPVFNNMVTWSGL